MVGESACSDAGDTGELGPVPGSKDPLEEEMWPLQYSFLKFMNRGPHAPTGGGLKESERLTQREANSELFIQQLLNYISYKLSSDKFNC